MSAIKTSSELFAAAALRTSVAAVDGVSVQIRELSLAARDEFQAAMKADGQTAAIVSVIKNGALNGEGARLLTDEDAAQLAEGSPSVAEGLAREILVLSGIWEDDTGEDES